MRVVLYQREVQKKVKKKVDNDRVLIHTGCVGKNQRKEKGEKNNVRQQDN